MAGEKFFLFSFLFSLPLLSFSLCFFFLVFFSFFLQLRAGTEVHSVPALNSNAFFLSVLRWAEPSHMCRNAWMNPTLWSAGWMLGSEGCLPCCFGYMHVFCLQVCDTLLPHKVSSFQSSVFMVATLFFNHLQKCISGHLVSMLLAKYIVTTLLLLYKVGPWSGVMHQSYSLFLFTLINFLQHFEPFFLHILIHLSSAALQLTKLLIKKLLQKQEDM